MGKVVLAEIVTDVLSKEFPANSEKLHAFLEVDTAYKDWIVRRITQYEFIENEDYVIETIKTKGRPKKIYWTTLDMAKELAMVENNTKGKKARRYFIEIEKKYRQTQPTNCPAADNMSTRIAGYKGQLALKKKEIERLRFELAIAKDEVKRANESAKYLDKLREKEKKLKHQAIMLEHNILDFAASYARLKEELLERAKTLKFIATEFEKRIENVDYFLQSIYKIFPKAKDVADNASKRHKKEIEFRNLMTKRT